MRYSTRHLLVAVAVAVGVAACGQASGFDNEAASDEGPSKVEPIRGTPYARVTLTREAARRVGIRTEVVRRAAGTGARRRTVMPYDAVVYDAEGHAFAFTSPRPLVYVRRPVRIARIEGGRALLAGGPPAGTPVVTVGAAELLGVEYGVEED